ncbi:MAG: DNA (cytosine-5-)-methyltransferase [Verrucomicrobia bacterium]|jgi:DNA (cytosine-5)-methyltransferase 1|nr:DNA (cytosine-5-)-methyltransferase [Verrucomicrobiota bacterium]
MFDGPRLRPSAIGLFSGCGGLDSGFDDQGYELSAAFDACERAVTTYNLNQRNRARVLEIDQNFSIPHGTDVVLAGPPCQGFSTGGGYKKDDPRNSLLLTTCQLIARSRAKVAVIENVASLTNIRNRRYLASALTILEDAGYHCEVTLLLASDYGVAQRRRRAIIVARSDKRHFTLAPETSEAVKLGEVLGGLSAASANHEPIFPDRQSKHFRIAQRIGPGQKLCNVRAGPASIPTWEIPECFGKTTQVERCILSSIRRLRRQSRKRDFGDADPVEISALHLECPEANMEAVESLVGRGYLRWIEGSIDLTNTFNGKYRRLDPNGASPTVDTRFGDVQLFLHPEENRGLTVREAARIQGFSDDFLFPSELSRKDIFRMIGNAVPPPMARTIANFCRELL